MNKTFLVKDILQQAWSKFKANPLPWMGALLFLVILGIGQSFLSYFLFGEKNSGLIPNLFYLVYELIAAGFSAGLVYMALREADGWKAQFKDLFSKFRLFFTYFLSSLIYSIIIAIGLLLLIVPGIVWAIQFGFFPYYIVDKNAGPIEALKLSSQATRGVKWNIFKLILAFIAIIFVGALFFLVGLFVSLPIVIISYAIVYRLLNQEIWIKEV